MGITVVDLTTLNPTSVSQFETNLIQLLQELNPSISVKSGIFQDWLIRLKAITDAATQENITLVREANSLAAINSNPALADPTIVANCVSNFNLVPSPGTTASGTITIVLSDLIGVVIPAGSAFTINGLSFISPVTYAARTSQGSVISSTDVLITAFGTNQWAFSIVIDAASVGEAGNVARALAVTVANPPPSFVNSFVASDFTGGTDPDTIDELMTKLASGMAIAAWSNRTSIESLLKKQSALSTIQSMSIIGFGDSEMLRDQHSIWPGSTGGRSDLYLRSQQLYVNNSVTVTATLISKVGPLGKWQFGIGRDDSPGFYKVDRILLVGQDPTSAGFVPSSDVRSFDLSDIVSPPDIVTAAEATYSRFQTAVIQFNDTITDATPLTTGSSTQDYVCVLQTMPLIAAAQDFLLGRDVMPPVCDVLVKAPIPCYTSISMTVNYQKGTIAPDKPTIQNAVADAVNSESFPGSLSVSFISSVLHKLLTNVVSVTSATLVGSIRNIDGSITSLSSASVITIPSTPSLMLSGRTSVFFLQPGDITITLNAVDVPNV